MSEGMEKTCNHGVPASEECRECLADSEAEVASAEVLVDLIPDIRVLVNRLKVQWLPVEVLESLERVSGYLERNFPEGANR